MPKAYGYGLGLGVWRGGSSVWTPANLGSSLKLWLKPESLENPNLILYSEDFSNAAWTKSADAVLTAGQTDPYGGSNAYLFEDSGVINTPIYQVSPVFQPGEAMTESLWLKRGPGHNGTSRFRLRFSDGIGQTDYFAVPPVNWTRVSVTRTLDVGATSAQMILYCDGDTGGNPVYIYGAQCELGSTMTDYVKNESTAGGIVAQWDDSSGSANHVTEGTQASMPLVQLDVLNGFSGAKYDGVDDRLGKTATAFTQPFERWVVFVEATGGSQQGYFGSTPAANLQTTTAYYITAGTPMVMTGRTAGAHPRLTRSLFNGASSRGEGWNWDGSGSHVSKVGNAGAGNMVEIRAGYTSGAGPDFWYVEDILIQGALSADDRLNMISYMAARYPDLGIS